jgi:hypothetical protein
LIMGLCAETGAIFPQWHGLRTKAAAGINSC